MNNPSILIKVISSLTAIVKQNLKWNLQENNMKKE